MRLHLKVPGWLSDLNALLTMKLPTFLSPSNEISGGYEYQSIILKVGLINITKFAHLDSI